MTGSQIIFLWVKVLLHYILEVVISGVRVIKFDIDKYYDCRKMFSMNLFFKFVNLYILNIVFAQILKIKNIFYSIDL